MSLYTFESERISYLFAKLDCTEWVKCLWSYVCILWHWHLLQDYFMDDDVSRTNCLQYKYTFLHPLSGAVMSQIVGAVANSDFDCNSPSYPIITWRTGVIRLHGPITLGLQYVNEGEFAWQLFDSSRSNRLRSPALNCVDFRWKNLERNKNTQLENFWGVPDMNQSPL